MTVAAPEGRAQAAPENVADLLRESAAAWPHARAIVLPGPRDREGRRAYLHQTFQELDASADRLARGLLRFGVRRGERVLLMVRPGFDFFALCFALFRSGAVPVLIDPGIGRRSLLGAIREVEASLLIGIPKAQLARRLFPAAFAGVRRAVVVGGAFPGATPLSALAALGEGAEPLPETRAEDVAAILFTSGSTGAPKGVLYPHSIFIEQVRIFRDELGIRPGEVDLSAFPLFSLFSAALGVTCVVPDMDAARPAQVRPELIVESIRDLGVTYSFGSPAFWIRVAAHAERERLTFPSLRRVLMAGAPAPVALLERLLALVPPGADVFTPYGATESLPVTMPSARLILGGPAERTRQGEGTFVGPAMGRTRLKILRISDEPLPALTPELELPAGEIGEIAVSGPVTTAGYFRRPADDARSKLKDAAGVVWHRMGDVGWLDGEGRLWFCGRKAHRVVTAQGTLFTEKVEAIFNQHSRVRRSALVGVGQRPAQRPVIVVECHPGDAPRGRGAEAALAAELLRLGATHLVSRPVERLLFHPSFPVDPRHNAKIIREELAPWAEAALAKGSGFERAAPSPEPQRDQRQASQ